jgi:hypothetical protein
MARAGYNGNGPPHPAGTPFRNSHLPTPQHDDTLHNAGNKIRKKAKGTGVPNVGSMPKTPPKGGLGKITP